MKYECDRLCNHLRFAFNEIKIIWLKLLKKRGEGEGGFQVLLMLIIAQSSKTPLKKRKRGLN